MEKKSYFNPYREKYMFIGFSVANFRSFRSRQTFSLATIKDNSNLHFGTQSRAVPYLLKTSAIYGANASGKSNLIGAMQFMRYFTVNSAKETQSGEKIQIAPFAFDDSASNKPSEFEAVFIYRGYLFQYGFTASKDRVYEEWLYGTDLSAQKQSTQKWYVRSENNHKEESYISKKIKGNKKVWMKATRDNALFLSTAVQLGSEQLKIPFDWIQNQFFIFPVNIQPSLNFTIAYIRESTKNKKEILTLMNKLDFSFNDIIFSEKVLSEESIKHIPEEYEKRFIGKKIFEPITIYTTSKHKKTPLPFSAESTGTQRLFAYSAFILKALNNNMTLVIDEINAALHPKALEGVVQLFKENKKKGKAAQLIFTSHDTVVMNAMEREEIWITEKNSDLETNLYSIADFVGKSNEAISKRYLSGRYGGIPNIRIVD